MLVLLLLVLLFAASAGQPTPSGPEPDPPTWTDKLEAWSTLGAAFVALAAAAATIWLLVHQIRETQRARGDAHWEREEAARDRELARQDREQLAAERRDAEIAQARAVVVGEISCEFTFVTTSPDDTKHVFLGRLRASVSNFSAQPILSVHLTAVSAVPTGSWPIRLKSSAVLAPGETLEFDDRVEGDSELGTSGDEALANLDIVATYVDSAGRRWRRAYERQPEAILD